MELIIIFIGVAQIAFLIYILTKFSVIKNTDITPQLIDLKNQIDELKTRQIEAQTKYLREQQELLLITQKGLSDQLNNLIKTVGDSLTNTQSNITSQLKNSNDVVIEIQRKLGALEATTKNIEEISKDISSLQEILKAPKLRGNLGEYLLEELLKEIFPAKNYELQYPFENGTKVDAVIKLGEGLVPIDSKFPLESFQRLISTTDEGSRKQYKKDFIKSVKERIDEIASKYINPSENTFDFAMMYIPAENVFYEIIVNDSLTDKEYEIFNYAIKKHIIPVSPNSFYAYLMALVYGLKGFKIEQQTKKIIGELSHLQIYFEDFYTDFTTTGKHLQNAIKKYEESQKLAERFNDKLSLITNVENELTESDIKSLKDGKNQ